VGLLKEVTAKGELVWELKTSGAVSSCQELDDGGFLFVDPISSAVKIVNRKKEIVWEEEFNGLTDAFMTFDGNIAIANYYSAAILTKGAMKIYNLTTRIGGTWRQ